MFGQKILGYKGRIQVLRPIDNPLKQDLNTYFFTLSGVKLSYNRFKCQKNIIHLTGDCMLFYV